MGNLQFVEVGSMDWLNLLTNIKAFIEQQSLNEICLQAKFLTKTKLLLDPPIGSRFLESISIGDRDVRDIYLSSQPRTTSSNSIEAVVKRYISELSINGDGDNFYRWIARDLCLKNVFICIEKRIIDVGKDDKEGNSRIESFEHMSPATENGLVQMDSEHNNSPGLFNLEFFVATSMSMSLASVVGLPEELHIMTMTKISSSLLNLLTLVVVNSNRRDKLFHVADKTSSHNDILEFSTSYAVSGAMGTMANFINGIYDITKEYVGNSPVYQKRFDVQQWLLFNTEVSCWVVQSSKYKHSTTFAASLKVVRETPPDSRGVWEVQDELAFQEQTSLTVTASGNILRDGLSPSRGLVLTCFHGLHPQSPLFQAFDETEQAVLNHLSAILTTRSRVAATQEEIFTTAKVELTLLFAIATVRKSLGRLLRIVDFLMAHPSMSILASSAPFWGVLDGSRCGGTHWHDVDDGAKQGMAIMDILGTATASSSFSISSSDECELLVRIIERNGTREGATSTDGNGCSTSNLCAAACKILFQHIHRHQVKMPHRLHRDILSDSLILRLRSALILVLQDSSKKNGSDSRSGTGSDNGSSEALQLFAGIKDVLFPDGKEQFKFVSETLASLSSSSPQGIRDFVMTLMSELTTENLIDMVGQSDDCTLFDALLCHLECALEMRIVGAFEDREAKHTSTQDDTVEFYTLVKTFDRITVAMLGVKVYAMKANAHNPDTIFHNLKTIVTLVKRLVDSVQGHISTVESLAAGGDDCDRARAYAVLDDSHVASAAPLAVSILHSTLQSFIETKAIEPKMLLDLGLDHWETILDPSEQTHRASVLTPRMSLAYRASVSTPRMSLSYQGTRSFPDAIGGRLQHQLNDELKSGDIIIEDDGVSAELARPALDGPRPSDEGTEHADVGLDGGSFVFGTMILDQSEDSVRNGNYFEMELLSCTGLDISVGVAHSPSFIAVAHGELGERPYSYGYRGEDGSRLAGSDGIAAKSGWPSWMPGDVIGCGIDRPRLSIFFTRNGYLLGYGGSLAQDAPPLSPVVYFGSQCHSAQFRFNFGQESFKFSSAPVVKRINPSAKLAWLQLIRTELQSMSLLAVSHLIAPICEAERQQAAAHLQSGLVASWLSSPLFVKGRITEPAAERDQQWKLLKYLATENDSNPEAMQLVATMRKKVLQDRRNAPAHENKVVHAVCAALLWHHGLGAEAVALVEGRRDAPSATIIALWTSAQRLRDIFKTRDDVYESQDDDEESLSPHLGGLRLSEAVEQIIQRANGLLETVPARKSMAVHNTNKKLWQAAAKLAALSASTTAAVQQDGGGTSSLNKILSVATMASTQRWLRDALRSRAERGKSAKERKLPTLADMIVRYSCSGPLPDRLFSTAARREDLASCRAAGYREIAALLSDTNTLAYRIRILAMVFSVVHSAEATDVHYLAHLQGISAHCTAEVESAWKAVVDQIVLSSRNAIAGYDAALRHSTRVDFLVLGISLLIQDFRESDVDMLNSCEVIKHLTALIDFPNRLLRSLSLKCIEMILYRCCLPSSSTSSQAPASAPAPAPALTSLGGDDALLAGEIDMQSTSTEAADSLMPVLMAIITTQLQRAVDHNVLPPIHRDDDDDDEMQMQMHATLHGDEFFWILPTTVNCDPIEPGFVSPHRLIPTSHSLGMWVWRPAGCIEGTLMVKGGAMPSSTATTPWSTLVVGLRGGHILVTVADGTKLDGFTVQSRHAVTVEGWLHVGYVIDISTKIFQLYINGLLDTEEVLGERMCSRVAHEVCEVRVYETDHPYGAREGECWNVAMPGATRYSIECDSRSRLKPNCEYLYFYRGTDRSELLGSDSYTGNMFPGYRGSPPLEIPHHQFEMHVQNDESDISRRLDWGVKVTVTAHVTVYSDDPDMKDADISDHPIYFGQAPAHVTPLRSAQGFVSNVCVVARPLSASEMASLPHVTAAVASTTDRVISPNIYINADIDGVLCQCDAAATTTRNVYAHLPCVKSICEFTVQSLGSSGDGFSLGLAQRGSIDSLKSGTSYFVFGLTGMSVGVHVSGSSCSLQTARSRNRTELPRTLAVGDVIRLSVNVDKAQLEVKVSGESMCVRMTFGLPSNLTSPEDYVVGASLAAGHAIKSRWTLATPTALSGGFWDLGLSLKRPAMNSPSAQGMFDGAESMGVLSAISRASRTLLRQYGSAGVHKLVSHGVLGSLIEMALRATSTALRLASLQVACHIMSHSSVSLVATAFVKLGLLADTESNVILELVKRLGQSLNPYHKGEQFASPVGLLEASQWSRMLNALLTSPEEGWKVRESLLSAIEATSEVLEQLDAFTFLGQDADVDSLEDVKCFVRSEKVNVAIGLLNVCSSQGQHDGLPGSQVMYNSSGSLAEKNIILGFSEEGVTGEFMIVAEESFGDSPATTQQAAAKFLLPRSTRAVVSNALKAAIGSEAARLMPVLERVVTLRAAMEGGLTSVLLMPVAVIASLLREFGIEALDLISTVTTSAASLWPLLLRECMLPRIKDNVPLSSVPSTVTGMPIHLLRIYKDQPNMHLLEEAVSVPYMVNHLDGANIRKGLSQFSEVLLTFPKKTFIEAVEVKVNQQGHLSARLRDGRGWVTVKFNDSVPVLAELSEAPATGNCDNGEPYEIKLTRLVSATNEIFSSLESHSAVARGCDGASSELDSDGVKSYDSKSQSWTATFLTTAAAAVSGSPTTKSSLVRNDLLNAFVASLSSSLSSEQRFVVNESSSTITTEAAMAHHQQSLAMSVLEKGIYATPAVIRADPETTVREVIQTSNAAKLYHLLCSILSSWPSGQPLLPGTDTSAAAAAAATTVAVTADTSARSLAAATTGDLFLLLKAAGLDSLDLRAEASVSPLLKALQYATNSTTQGDTSVLTTALATIGSALFERIFSQDGPQLELLLMGGDQLGRSGGLLDDLLTGFDIRRGTAAGYTFVGMTAECPQEMKLLYSEKMIEDSCSPSIVWRFKATGSSSWGVGVVPEIRSGDDHYLYEHGRVGYNNQGGHGGAMFPKSMHEKVVTVLLSTTQLTVWIDEITAEKFCQHTSGPDRQDMTEAFPVRLALSSFGGTHFELLPIESGDPLFEYIADQHIIAMAQPNISSEHTLEKYTRPSLIMALRLFESVVDMGATSCVFSTHQGLTLLAGLSNAVGTVHMQAINIAHYVLELACKIVWAATTDGAKGKAPPLTEQAQVILTAIGTQLIQLARRTSESLSKNVWLGAPTPLFKAACQAAVMSANLLHLDLFEVEQPTLPRTRLSPPSLPPPPPSRTVESPHPFQDNRDDYWTVELPGASMYIVSFDDRTSLPSGADYVRFYKADSHDSVWGKDKYYGGNLPGTGDVEPLLIATSKFVVHFHSSNAASRHRCVSIVEGATVRLAPAYALRSDADTGPLQPGDEGEVVSGSGSGRRNVRALSGDREGETWWYDVEALEMLNPVRDSTLRTNSWGFKITASRFEPIKSAARVLESDHPYKNNSNHYTVVEIPGVAGFVITFHESTKTELDYDYICFYKDDSHSICWGDPKYSGGMEMSRRNFPGVGGNLPLLIPASRFVFHFFSDGSNKEWGYKCTIEPFGMKEGANLYKHSLHTLERLHKTFLRLIGPSVSPSVRQVDTALIQYVEAATKTICANSRQLMALDWKDVVAAGVSESVELNSYPVLFRIVNDELEGIQTSSTSLILPAAAAVAIDGSAPPTPPPLSESMSPQLDLDRIFAILISDEEDQAAFSEIVAAGFDPFVAYAAFVENDMDPNVTIIALLEDHLDPQILAAWTLAALAKSDCEMASIVERVWATEDAHREVVDGAVKGILADAPAEARSPKLAERFNLIKQFNTDYLESSDLIDLGQTDQTFSIAHQLTRCRNCLFSTITAEIFFQAMRRSDGGAGANFDIKLSRDKAAKLSAAGDCDSEGRWSIFGQIFRSIHGRPSSSLRNVNYLWSVTFTGEPGLDHGGLYRESWTLLCQELMSTTLPLLIPSANTKSGKGDNQGSWVLNPDSTSPDQIQMFEFLGKLMGTAARSERYMEIALAPTVWKLLVKEEHTVADLESVDLTEATLIKEIMEASPECIESYDLYFIVHSSGGTMVELHPGGERDLVTWENRELFVEELLRYRLAEMNAVAEAVRRGLCTQVPHIALAMLRWSDLEKRVCGTALIDVALLYSATEYDGYSESDDVVRWFWEILTEFSQEQRKAYLKFVWGRSRLPLTKDQFSKCMKISKFELSDPDTHLPAAHTCFFSLDLPSYSSKEIMRGKLIYAVTQCIGFGLG